MLIYVCARTCSRMHACISKEKLTLANGRFWQKGFVTRCYYATKSQLAFLKQYVRLCRCHVYLKIRVYCWGMLSVYLFYIYQINCVIVGLDTQFSYLKLARAISYLAKDGCHFVATNTDTGLPIGSGKVLPGNVNWPH